MSICLPCREQPHLPEVCADHVGCFCQHKMDDRIWGWADGIGYYNLTENLENAARQRARDKPKYGVAYARTIPAEVIDVPLPEPESTPDRQQQSR